MEESPLLFHKDGEINDDAHNHFFVNLSSASKDYNLHFRPLIDIDLITVNNLFWNLEGRDTEDKLSPCAMPLLFLFSLISALVSSLSAVPYLTYSGEAPEEYKQGICITRYIIYLSIFCSYWLYLTVNLIHSSRYGLIRHMKISWQYVGRQVFNVLFSSTYTILYAVKWVSVADIDLPILSIPCFCASWFLVYYSVIDKHLSSSISTSGSSTSNVHSRKRRMLLSSIKYTENNLRVSNLTHYIAVLRKSKNLSLLFSCHSVKALGLPSEERLVIYERDWHSGMSEICSDVVNGLLGFSLIALTLSLLEDYGHAVKLVVHQEEVFLWVITLASLFLGTMYLIATRPIHHKTLRKILGSLYNICSLKYCTLSTVRANTLAVVKRLPLMIAAGLVASLRVNASYIIFGRLTGRFDVPYTLGITLIWSGILITFYIDYGACLKIVSCSVKMLLTLVSLVLHRILPDTLCGTADSEAGSVVSTVKNVVVGYSVRWYTKYAKWLVRNCDEEMLDSLFEEFM